MSSINIVGYRTQRVSLPELNGKIYGAVMLLVVVAMLGGFFASMGKGLEKTNKILEARYASQR